jgi:large subunit ribosomal protein LP2
MTLHKLTFQVLMAEGMSKLASVPSAAGSAAAPKVAAAAPVVKEEKKKETSEEESDGDMGMGLFD